MNKQYIIDDNNVIYDVSQLDKNNGVREFMEDNLTPITWEEIQEQKNVIMDSYTEEPPRESYAYSYWNCHGDYSNDIEFLDLEELEASLEYATVLRLKDENYNKILSEAKKYGYCG